MCVSTDDPEKMRDAMKRVAVVLKEAEVPFALAGGYAAFARGGPESDHDVDFYLRADDIDAASRALGEAGLRGGQPPADWLGQAHHGGAGVGPLHHPPRPPPPTHLVRPG